MTEKSKEPCWYVVHTYSGYENKVKDTLEKSVENNGMQNLIFDVRVPVEDVVEIKNGKRVKTQRKVYPGYVLVHMLTIYPFLRGQLLGRVAAELIARCYAGKRGVLFCQSRTSPMLPERERLLKTNGYRDTGFRFRWNGQPAALYLRPCQSTEDITPVAQLLLRDLYGDLLTPVNARRMIQPEV